MFDDSNNNEHSSVAEETMTEEQAIEANAGQASETKTDIADEPEQEPIPEELEGLPDKYAREVMEKAKASAPKDEGKETQGNAGQASETKTEEDLETVFKSTPKGSKVPYERFEHAYKEIHALRDKLAAIKKQQTAQQPPAQQLPAQQPVAQAPAIHVTSELAKAINTAARQAALQLAGMTQEQVDALEYSEDDDPDKMRYDVALNMARNNIVQGLQREQQARQAEAARFMRMHEDGVADFNAFAQKESQEPDFQDVKAYAVNEFFNSLPKLQQQVMKEANDRIERNTASPAEIQLVKNYFMQAKQSFRAKQAAQKGAKTRAANAEVKAKQAQSLSRYDQVSGTADTGSVSEAMLAKMLHEKNFRDIPEEYQRILLGM